MLSQSQSILISIYHQSYLNIKKLIIDLFFLILFLNIFLFLLLLLLLILFPFFLIHVQFFQGLLFALLFLFWSFCLYDLDFFYLLLWTGWIRWISNIFLHTNCQLLTNLLYLFLHITSIMSNITSFLQSLIQLIIKKYPSTKMYF